MSFARAPKVCHSRLHRRTAESVDILLEDNARASATPHEFVRRQPVVLRVANSVDPFTDKLAVPSEIGHGRQRSRVPRDDSIDVSQSQRGSSDRLRVVGAAP